MIKEISLNVQYKVDTINSRRLQELVIKQHFGNSASKLVGHISKKGGSTLNDLKTKFPEIQVKATLIRLLKHQCLLFSRSYPVVYRTNPTQITHRIRFPLYMEIIEQLYGPEAVQILNEFCEKGSVQGKGKVWDSMVLHHFIAEQESRYFDDQQADIDAATENLSIIASAKDIASSLKLYDPPAKKKKLSPIYILNFSRFDVELRNEFILKSVTLNRQASLTLKAILDVSASHLKGCEDVGGIVTPDHISKKITPEDSKLYDAVHSSTFDHEEKIIAYFDILAFHGYIYKSHFGSGKEEPEISKKVIQQASSEDKDQFLVPYKYLKNLLQSAVIESSIRTRLGSKAVRVYQAMKRLKNADEKMLANEAMLPSSEARQLLYALTMAPGMATSGGSEGGIIGGYPVFEVLPIFKSQERNPLRGHYLYKIKTEEQLKHDILDSLYKCEYNCLSRLLEEERKHRIIEIRASKGDDQFSESSKKLLKNYNLLRKRLWDSLLLTDQLVAIFRDF